MELYIIVGILGLLAIWLQALWFLNKWNKETQEMLEKLFEQL